MEDLINKNVTIAVAYGNATDYINGIVVDTDDNFIKLNSGILIGINRIIFIKPL